MYKKDLRYIRELERNTHYACIYADAERYYLATDDDYDVTAEEFRIYKMRWRLTKHLHSESRTMNRLCQGLLAS